MSSQVCQKRFEVFLCLCDFVGFIAHSGKVIPIGQPLGREILVEGIPQAKTLFRDVGFLFDTEQYGMHGDDSVRASPGRLLRSKIR